MLKRSGECTKKLMFMLRISLSLYGIKRGWEIWGIHRGQKLSIASKRYNNAQSSYSVGGSLCAIGSVAGVS